jgi:type II secretory pathway component PulM
MAEADRYLGQLSRRERMMVSAAGACFVLFVLSIIYTSFSHSISRHEISIEEKNGYLQKIAVYAQNYAQTERSMKELKLKLSGPPVPLMSELSTLASNHTLNVGAMNDRGEQKIGQLQEKLVEMQIAEAPIDQLVDLLNDIEHDPKIIKVRKLRLRRTAADATTLNVILTVGSYQLLPSKG